MEGGIYCDIGIFIDVVTKMAFDHKPKSTIKGGNRELIEGLGD